MTERTLLHERTTKFKGFRRADDLWEIEATLLDAKSKSWPSGEKGMMPPETPVHHMLIRAALDDAMEIREIELSMPSTPYSECQTAIPGLQKLVGRRMSSGWRKAVDECLGGIAGCTHVRELLVNMGTAAYQTFAGEQLRDTALNGNQKRNELDDPSKFTQANRCVAWNLDGPMVQRHYPLIYQKRLGK
ncbi:DUF2889 domain-containing protein [Ottowia caeni]|uniref:DUF2889 domain-containing protein n=1 Tax=Ottowia caeni TaxID=2870339 RepID=UPI001E4F0684|nr:DUF2889 domain-containing protein [Ottowia caeni]